MIRKLTAIRFENAREDENIQRRENHFDYNKLVNYMNQNHIRMGGRFWHKKERMNGPTPA